MAENETFFDSHSQELTGLDNDRPLRSTPTNHHPAFRASNSFYSVPREPSLTVAETDPISPMQAQPAAGVPRVELPLDNRSPVALASSATP